MKVALKWGTWKKAKDLDSLWNKVRFNLFDTSTNRLDNSNAVCYMRREENNSIYKIRTVLGNELIVTADHPVLTDKGMKIAANLLPKEKVISRSFIGVEFEQPSSEVIISEKDIEKTLDELGFDNKGNSRSQIKAYLKNLGLIEIRLDSPAVPTLLKLMGFIFGDGVISFINKKKGFVHFYANREDLNEIKADIESLGFKCPNIFERLRDHHIETYYGTQDFRFNETSIMKKSTAFAVLMVALGVPYGKKVTKTYRVPKWILKAPLWQKRLFLASLFGAELSTPSTLNKYNFYEPQLNMNKLESIKDNAIDFLNDIRLILSEFGVESSYPVDVNGYQYKGKDGKTVGIRLKIKSRAENLIKFYESVGFEYNKRKIKKACAAISYLKLKKNVIEQSAQKSGQNLLFRISSNFISFKEFEEKFLLGEDGFVLDEICNVEKIPYNGFVYDITMNHHDHNFIANNFVISNCGMRLIRTNLTIKEVKPKIKELVDVLFKTVPAGVGGSGFVKINRAQFQNVMVDGVKWCVDNGYGWKQDLERIEDYGQIKGADPSKVSDKAIKRGIDQIGTLGSGNHYLEIQVAEKIHDPVVAKAFGFDSEGQIGIMIHCGSRGFGHQIGTDYLQVFDGAMKKYGITVPDRELACAPFSSKEGQDYYHAMACAANMAFCNRQVILHRVREAFAKVFKQSAENLGLELVYDVAHNIAKIEEHVIDGKKYKVVMHRKGSTRCFGPSRTELPPIYKNVGQPVIIGGSMETGSYLLVGTDKAEETFGSTMHGSGRTMSRTQAAHEIRGDKLQKDMEKHGIIVKAVSMSGLAEEAGAAYKDINEVVETMEIAGISKKVIQLKPLGNVKG